MQQLLRFVIEACWVWVVINLTAQFDGEQKGSFQWASNVKWHATLLNTKYRKQGVDSHTEPSANASASEQKSARSAGAAETDKKKRGMHCSRPVSTIAAWHDDPRNDRRLDERQNGNGLHRVVVSLQESFIWHPSSACSSFVSHECSG